MRFRLKRRAAKSTPPATSNSTVVGSGTAVIEKLPRLAFTERCPVPSALAMKNPKLLAGKSRLGINAAFLNRSIALVPGHFARPSRSTTKVLFSVFGTQSHPELSTIPAVFKHLVMAFHRMALAPFAWVTAEGPAPLYGLYPGMWFLYLVVYPLGLAGVAEAVARDRRQAAVPLVAAMASCGVFLAVYGGDATRQRLFLEVILMPFAAFGWSARRRGAWAAAWFATLILFAAAQSARLAMRQP